MYSLTPFIHPITYFTNLPYSLIHFTQSRVYSFTLLRTSNHSLLYPLTNLTHSLRSHSLNKNIQFIHSLILLNFLFSLTLQYSLTNFTRSLISVVHLINSVCLLTNLMYSVTNITLIHLLTLRIYFLVLRIYSLYILTDLTCSLYSSHSLSHSLTSLTHSYYLLTCLLAHFSYLLT